MENTKQPDITPVILDVTNPNKIKIHHTLDKLTDIELKELEAYINDKYTLKVTEWHLNYQKWYY